MARPGPRTRGLPFRAITFRATAPREPVASVINPVSSSNTTTLGRPRARWGTAYSRIRHSILVRNAA